jgi:hypothetical protein
MQVAPLHAVALIVDNFAIQNVGSTHLDHLCQALKKHYEVSEELDGTRFAGMTLTWNYGPIHAERSCHLAMPGYICNVHTKYKHPMPTKRQLSPHKHCESLRPNQPAHPQQTLQSSTLRRRRQENPRHHWRPPLLHSCSRQQAPCHSQYLGFPTSHHQQSHHQNCRPAS